MDEGNEELTMNMNEILEKIRLYSNPSQWKSIFQIGMTITLVFFAYTLLFYISKFSFVLAFFLSLPAGLLLVRLFIIQHDAGHGSLFKAKIHNHITGFIISCLTFTPYLYWRKCHNIHHQNSGNLDARGTGDITLLTVNEYQNLSAVQKFKYRLLRHPIILIGFGGVFHFFIQNHFFWQPKQFKHKFTKQEIFNIYYSNVIHILLLIALACTLGYKFLLFIILPSWWVAAGSGIFLFYVQHTFENAYFVRKAKWNYYEAALSGSSFFDLPIILRWFSGNIGYHHLHHLSPKIPFYKLPKCHNSFSTYFKETVRRVSLKDIKSTLKLRLFDEKKQQLICFKTFSLLREN